MTSEQNLAVLKKQRAIIKASCMRTNTYIGAITTVIPSVIAQLKERKIKLDQY